jgi:uncharacterized protein with ParB-like and HNH nuclease domain
MAFEDLTIYEAIRNIDSKKYLLPSIQRKFVWKEEQITNLFDSLMMNYPIGSFLFWDVNDSNKRGYPYYEFIRNYRADNMWSNERAKKSETGKIIAVIDGQQRLTSLYIGLMGSYTTKKKGGQWGNPLSHLEKELYLNLLKKADGDDDAGGGDDEKCTYNFKFREKDEDENPDVNHYWFRVGDIRNKEFSTRGGITSYIRRKKIGKDNRTKFNNAKKALLRLRDVIYKEHPISYYLEKCEKIDEVLKIFVRANQGGTSLSYSDMLLSTAAAQWEDDDAHKKINDAVSAINDVGFSVKKDFILKACLVLCDCNVEFKLKNFNTQNLKKIKDNWDNVSTALRTAGELVHGWGFDDSSIVSYNLLIPIAYYIRHRTSGKRPSEQNVDKMRKWFVYSLLKRVFSGSSDNALKTIKNTLKDNPGKDFPLEAIVKDSRNRLKTLEFSETDIKRYVEKINYDSPDIHAVMSVLYKWPDTGVLHHIDHIFPQSQFKPVNLRKEGIDPASKGFSKSACNNIANLQFLEGPANTKKNDTPFDKWLNRKRQDTRKDFCKRQLIPLMEDYSLNNFEAFLEKRKQLIIKRLKEELRRNDVMK